MNERVRSGIFPWLLPSEVPWAGRVPEPVVTVLLEAATL